MIVTRANAALRIVGRLREEFHDLGRCVVDVTSSAEPVIAAVAGPLVLHLTVTIRVDAPSEVVS